MTAPQPIPKHDESLVERLVEAFEREVRHRDPHGRALARLEDLDDTAAARS